MNANQSQQFRIPDDWCQGMGAMVDLSKEAEYEMDGEMLDTLESGPFFDRQRYLSQENWEKGIPVTRYAEKDGKYFVSQEFRNAPFEEKYVRGRTTGHVYKFLLKL